MEFCLAEIGGISNDEVEEKKNQLQFRQMRYLFFRRNHHTIRELEARESTRTSLVLFMHIKSAIRLVLCAIVNSQPVIFSKSLNVSLIIGHR